MLVSDGSLRLAAGRGGARSAWRPSRCCWACAWARLQHRPDARALRRGRAARHGLAGDVHRVQLLPRPGDWACAVRSARSRWCRASSPCKDDVDVIERCVRSMLESDATASLEVIVVDDGSTDGSCERLRRADPERCRPLPAAPERGVGRQEAGAGPGGRRTARGEFFVFTDSDCVLDPDAVEQAHARVPVATPRSARISGHARALNADHNVLTRMQDVWYDGQFAIWKAAESVFGSVTCVSGPLAAFRREAIYNYLPAWAEDSFLGQRVPVRDRPPADRLRARPGVGRGAASRSITPTRPFVSDGRLPAAALGGRLRPLGAGVDQGASHVRGRSSASRRGGRRASSATCASRGTFYWRRGLCPGAALLLALPVRARRRRSWPFRHLIWLPLHGRVVR